MGHLSKRRLRPRKPLSLRKLPSPRRLMLLRLPQLRSTLLPRTPPSPRRMTRNTKQTKLPSSQIFHQSSLVPLAPLLQLLLVTTRLPSCKPTAEDRTPILTAAIVIVTPTEKQILTAIEKVGIRNDK